MRKLKLVGLSADGRSVVFVDEAGAEFASPADDRLRAALRGDRARLGQLEIEMDSALRPRDIQARIRAGETPDAVAVLARVSVEKIMPFCVPVLAERQHLAETARRSHVRRKGVDGPSKRLGDLVAERLSGRSVDPASAEWDAWRRDDGRWSVQATYQSGESEHTAGFVFDAVGRFSLADDDEAKWLTGERQTTRKGPQPRPAASKAEGGRQRRLAAVPPAHDDLLSIDAEAAGEEVRETFGAGYDDEYDAEGDDLTAVVRATQDSQDQTTRPDPADLKHSDVEDDAVDADEDRADIAEALEPQESQQSDEDYEATQDDGDDRDDGDASEPGVGAAAQTPVVDAAEAESQSADESPADEPGRERRRRTRGRASVPSWDEIMLGASKPE